jgi:hypothetical protein
MPSGNVWKFCFRISISRLAQSVDKNRDGLISPPSRATRMPSLLSFSSFFSELPNIIRFHETQGSLRRFPYTKAWFLSLPITGRGKTSRDLRQKGQRQCQWDILKLSVNRQSTALLTFNPDITRRQRESLWFVTLSWTDTLYPIDLSMFHGKGTLFCWRESETGPAAAANNANSPRIDGN